MEYVRKSNDSRCDGLISISSLFVEAVAEHRAWQRAPREGLAEEALMDHERTVAQVADQRKARAGGCASRPLYRGIVYSSARSPNAVCSYAA
jgi:hypothetical protein